MIEIEAIRGDILTGARQKRGDVDKTESPRGGVEFRTAQTPMDFYLKRRNITPHEYRAGERLFRDFALSGQTPGMIYNLDPVRGGERQFTHSQMEARERWRRAIGSVQGKVGQLMLLNVCCYGYWLKDVNYMPYKSKQSMPRFREALEYLIDHYKNS